MNFIQTLYIDTHKDSFRDSFGWAAPEYHIMSWALSCLQLHKLYGDITLYANSPAARLLIDTLQLPYTEVNLSQDALTLIHPDLWALPKIYTYSLQKQPFLHIDGDVFLFSPFESGLLEGELIAQNVEVETEDYYTHSKRSLMQHFSFFPPCVKKEFESELPFQACNAGILGGNNVSFFHDFAAMAFEYVGKNADRLKDVTVNSFNIFFEQHLFYALAKEKGIPVSVLIDGIIEDNGYKNMGDFHDIPFNRSYLHLLGHFKRDEYTCIQMAAKLRELYPDYYERIVALFHKKNIRLSPNCFSNPPHLRIKNVSEHATQKIDEQANTHLQRLKHAMGRPPDIEKEQFQNDFEKFYQQLISFVSISTIRGFEYLQKRDLEAQHWYRNLFANSFSVLNQVIVRCLETEIIESAFDWAGLFNKHYRVGVGYYSALQVAKGHFFNLIVYEATDNGFSLYDINNLEHAMFRLLSEPLSISDVLTGMQIYFEEDAVKNHYAVYQKLILSAIKQLVIIKAVQPT